MSKGKNIRNIAIKSGLILSTLLFGSVMTGWDIAQPNRTAISNQLGQPTFEIVGKTDERRFDSDFTSLDELIKAGKTLVKDIEAEGAILLKNENNALPLVKEDGSAPKVSLFGITSVNISVGGRGSSHTSTPQPKTDLKTGLEMAGIEVNDVLNDEYVSYKNNKDVDFTKTDVAFDKIMESQAVKDSVNEYSDAAIFTITRTGGESNDLKHEMKDGVLVDDLALRENEKSVLAGLGRLKAQGKINKIIVLLNTTNQIQEKEFNNPAYGIDAEMWIGHVGITGTEAIGELLTGKITPSGHTVDTFWYDHQDNPVMKNSGVFTYTNRADFSELPKTKRNDRYGTYVAYQEGIYLGYRYTETRYTDVVNGVANAGTFNYGETVSAPFGYGLSYTTFDYSDYKVTYDKNTKTYNVQVKVTNTGEVAGRDAVQIYLQRPYTAKDIERKLEKPSVELVGYAKTEVIQPKASEIVNITVNEDNFKIYDAEGAKTYIITEGNYLLTAAHDAHDAANNFLAFNGKSMADGMDANGNKKLVKGFNYKDDFETYSVSRATNNKITNLFDEANINKNELAGDNKLEFLSRTNWNKELNNELKLTQEMVNFIMAQENSNGVPTDNGKYPTYGAKNDLQLIQLLDLDYNDPKWDLFLDQLTWDETVSLISNGLRCSNESIRLGKPKTKDHNGPTGLTEIYNKGEGIAKQTNDPLGNLAPVYYPSIPVLAATFNKDLAKRFGNLLGNDCLWAGYNGLYGIGLNSHRSPYAGRHFEYFSEDPFLAGTMAAEEVKELQAHGVNAYIKHFALNDQESQRNGIQVWSNEQALREISLRPYEYAVIDGGAVNAMASFSRIGMTNAPASHALITDFLRGELGMKGFVVTDMYNIGYKPEQMVSFLMAGTDLPDGEIEAKYYNQFKTGYANVANQMREAAKRTMYTTLHSNAMNGFNENTRVNSLVTPWEKALNGAVIGTSIFFGGMIVLGVVVLIVDNKSKFLKK